MTDFGPEFDEDNFNEVPSDFDWAVEELQKTRAVGEGDGKIEFAFEETEQSRLARLGSRFTSLINGMGVTPNREPTAMGKVAASHREKADFHKNEYYKHRDTNPSLAALHQEERYKYIGWAATLEREARGIT